MALDNNNPKYQKILILHSGKFTIHYVILNSALSTRIIFFLTAQCRKADFLIQSKGIPSTDICEYPTEIFLLLDYECTILERIATIAIDLKIEINATQDLK